jgi:RsiW-degrading membrane proteinase PrsW (M82 family)
VTAPPQVRPRTIVWLGLATALVLWATAAGFGARVFTAALVASVVPLPIYLAAALWLDRFEPEPRGMLAMAFLWGASVAVVAAGIINQMADASLGELVSSTVSAPIAEELLKAFILFRFYSRKKTEFDGVVDGVIYAAMVGLGFAFMENIDYYGRALIKDGPNGLAMTFTLRGIMAPFSHPLFTGATGVGLGLARQTHRRWVRRLAPAAGLLVAMGLHAGWNAGASMGCVFFVVYGAVMIPAMIGLLTVAAFSLRAEGRLIRTYLAIDRERGVLSEDEYRLLCSVRGRLRALLWTVTHDGWAAWRRRKAFHQAASEVAFHRHRVADGDEPADEAIESDWASRLLDAGMGERH